MKLINRHSLACEAAEHWEVQYRGTTDTEHLAIGKKLKELGPTPNPDDVDRVVGNGSWTCLEDCRECRVQEVVTVMVGDTWLCWRCLRQAIQLLERTREDSNA